MNAIAFRPQQPDASNESGPSAAARRLHVTGMALFGPRYQGALARELGVSRPLVHAMVNDQRRVTPQIEVRLAAIIRERMVPRLEAKIERLAGVASAIEIKLGLERVAG